MQLLQQAAKRWQPSCTQICKESKEIVELLSGETELTSGCYQNMNIVHIVFVSSYKNGCNYFILINEAIN